MEELLTGTHDPIIRTVQVRKCYYRGKANEVLAVDDATIAILRGDIAVLKGPSGSGKTTLLSLIGCMTRPSAGSLLVEDVERQVVGPGYKFIQQGEPSDAIYYLESGGACAELELGDGRTGRLRTIRPGTMIGEMGLYLHQPRSASVVTTQPSVLYCLTEVALQDMESEHPELGSGLHLHVARVLAERLAEDNNLVSALLD